MSEEDIKQQFCSELESILMEVRLQNYKTDDGDSFPLLDFLSSQIDNTISTGREEIKNIVEQIYFRLDELSIFSDYRTEAVTITDEEIENEMTDLAIWDFGNNAIFEKGNVIEQRICGAKWMRSKLTNQ